MQKRFWKFGSGETVDIVRGKRVNLKDILFLLETKGIEVEESIVELLLSSSPVRLVSNAVIDKGVITGVISGIGTISYNFREVYLEKDGCLILDEGVVPLDKEQNNIARTVLLF